MATIDVETVSAAVFVLCGIVIVVGLVIHYAWPDKSRTQPNKPRSTLGGVIQLLMIVVGLMVAIALWDAFAMSIGSRGAQPGVHLISR